MAYQPTGGASASETPTLLWTNPSPTSNFNAQTVSIDLTDYEAFLIYTKGQSSTNTYNYNYVKKTDTGKWILADYQGDVRYATLRQITNITDSGMTFGNGAYGWSNNSGSKYCIPVEIYGLKKAII